MMPDCADVVALIVKGFTVPLVVAKHAAVLNVGFASRVTVPAIPPGDGGVLKVTVPFTGLSNAVPPPVSVLSSEPEARPDEIVGRNVAVKVPGLVRLVVLQAEASPVSAK